MNTSARTLDYPFTEAQMDAAAKEWGCNCGPSALAFALQISLDQVRPLIPDFEKKGYTSPTMMKAALSAARREWHAAKALEFAMFASAPALVRIQFTGPWTETGANPRWAYHRTHWITCWSLLRVLAGSTRMSESWVFDCNGGVRSFSSWKKEILPILVASYSRADGGWYPTHVWRLA